VTMKISIVTILSTLLIQTSEAFTPSALHAVAPNKKFARAHDDVKLFTSTSSETDTENEAISKTQINSRISVPLSFDAMARDTSNAMEQAYEQGITRQIIRVLLPRDPNSGNLGNYIEEGAVTMNTRDMVLVPTDESWQGGIMQLYRAAAPTCREILRRFSKGTAGVPPKIIEDRSIDDSGVDGVGLLMTQNRDAADDVCCFIQPMQETVDAIEKISKEAGDRLVVMVNPQWRQVDDALDSASKNGGVFGSIAGFLGGKGGSLRRLDENGFKSVLSIEGYICKGRNVRLVKRFDSDWIIFAENDGETDFIRIGEAENRPTYQEVDTLMTDAGMLYSPLLGPAPPR